MMMMMRGSQIHSRPRWEKDFDKEKGWTVGWQRRLNWYQQRPRWNVAWNAAAKLMSRHFRLLWTLNLWTKIQTPLSMVKAWLCSLNNCNSTVSRDRIFPPRTGSAIFPCSLIKPSKWQRIAIKTTETSLAVKTIFFFSLLRKMRIAVIQPVSLDKVSTSDDDDDESLVIMNLVEGRKNYQASL